MNISLVSYIKDADIESSSLWIYTGFQTSYLINGSSKVTGRIPKPILVSGDDIYSYEPATNISAFNRINYSILFGIDYGIKRLLFNIQMDYGLNNISKFEEWGSMKLLTLQFKMRFIFGKYNP